MVRLVREEPMERRVQRGSRIRRVGYCVKICRKVKKDEN